jgi:hypothetical protein
LVFFTLYLFLPPFGFLFLFVLTLSLLLLSIASRVFFWHLSFAQFAGLRLNQTVLAPKRLIVAGSRTRDEN